MITLLQNGAWLLNGQEIVEDTADSTTILNSKLGYVPEKKDAMILRLSVLFRLQEQADLRNSRFRMY